MCVRLGNRDDVYARLGHRDDVYARLEMLGHLNYTNEVESSHVLHDLVVVGWLVYLEDPRELCRRGSYH